MHKYYFYLSVLPCLFGIKLAAIKISYLVVFLPTCLVKTMCLLCVRNKSDPRSEILHNIDWGVVQIGEVRCDHDQMGNTDGNLGHIRDAIAQHCNGLPNMAWSDFLFNFSKHVHVHDHVVSF